MDIVIRADANKHVGIGHIMRCLSLADAFKASGHEISFLLADDGIANLINERGYKAIILHSNYFDMESELSLWPDLTPKLIIVDSYYVTYEYLTVLLVRSKAIGSKLVYFDDVCAFPYPVDVLVNYNSYSALALYEKLYKGSQLVIPKLLLGPSYAPLRLMFRGIPKHSQSDTVKNILLSTGGSDILHITRTFIQNLHERSHIEKNILYEMKFHILVGSMNPDKDQINQMARNHDNIIIHENVTDMMSLISKCDIAVSAAGSTLYEICACGVPLITYSIADNQIASAEAFEHLGIAINIGDLRNPNTIVPQYIMSGLLEESAVQRIMLAIQELSSDYQKRHEMSDRMQKIVDGYGADRIVRELLQYDC